MKRKRVRETEREAEVTSTQDSVILGTYGEIMSRSLAFYII